MDPYTWLAAFASMMMLDMSWVLYMRSVAREAPMRAALWAGGIHLFSAIAVLSYTVDPMYLTASASGTVLGTWMIVAYMKHKDRSGH